MKTFQQYLVESEKTFDYRIKIVGDITPEFLKAFKEKLKKFDPVSISEPKRTPILSKLTDFPEQSNQSMTLIDAKFRYPATPPQIEQIAELLGVTANRICSNDLKYIEGMDKELLGIESQTDLLTTDYPEPDAEQKKLSKEHADCNQQLVKNSAGGAQFTIAGGKTPPAETTNDLPQGIVSPMTAVKRPPKPVTGKNPRG